MREKIARGSLERKRNDPYESFENPDGARMKITLDAIETLAAIAQHGSFAAAAKALHKTQSAVSYAVKQLEDGLGVAIFDRAGHRAVLTDAGRAVLDEGRQLLARAERIEAMAARFHEKWEPRIEIVIDGILPMDPILRALKRMADEAVPTAIQIKVEFLGGVHARFEKDRADAMLVKDYVRSALLVERPLAAVPCVLVASSQHAVAIESANAPLTLRDLQRHVELTVHDSSESKRLEDTRIFGGPRVFYLSDFSTKKHALLLGLGFGWMPLYLVADELASGALVEIAYDGGSRYSFVPAFVHPADRPLGRAGQRFFDLLTA
jgi:DNA-binding transcriptional LysR family regulator